MFGFFRKNRIIKYTGLASEYLEKTFDPEAINAMPSKETVTKFRVDTMSEQSIPDIKEDVKSAQESNKDNDENVLYSSRENDDVLYSRSESFSLEDKYDSKTVAKLMKKYNLSKASPVLLKEIEENIDKTFVDALMLHISKKGMRDADVYKAAQIDRRLFSKIMSDREYKPSKDTVLALSIALKLSLEEVNDLLSRAGYTLSHSNKKDVIIEYFFREQIYKLDDINAVLFNLEQKIVGR